MVQTFDAIIIGAGQAGPPLAARLSDAGMTVALIERGLFGGTCVNTGCTPTKALVASARVAFDARRAAEFGVTTGGEVRVDLQAVQNRQRAMAAKSRRNVEAWIRGLAHCTVFQGHASFTSQTEIKVDGAVLASSRIFINVGGRSRIPDLPGINQVPYLTNSSILQLDTLPRHLVIVGGGYIGLEFAQIFRRFGSAVTVVDRKSQLLGREDKDISSAVQGILEAEDVAFRLGSECISFRQHEPQICVGIAGESGASEVLGSHVLLAMGRQPNTDDLGLDRAGVAVDDRSFVVVNDRLETNVPGIYALGECNGRGSFTHTAYNDFEIAAANTLDGADRNLATRLPTYALFIDPPLGRVGMTQSEAIKAGHRVLVGQRPMARVGRAVEKGDTMGLMKVMVDADTDLILGAAILGTCGDEAVHGLIGAIHAGVTATDFQQAMPIHPTVSELIPTILGAREPAA
ncbi:FAD-containing oxidoreductase [Paracoccus liaowanqingii]|uniref:FAD-containing oxidoreductase n=1 Tax=Paracoccus liaowanqingii TaxID=2560053 RepID=A0A4Z1C7F0_9RHOB|nr:FAD-containing oxidoreductase [Paracoccus liaowanqingii]TGN38668.1 FAD-containing oxidoreductase [Paracoccus liaowanqingii]